MITTRKNESSLTCGRSATTGIIGTHRILAGANLLLSVYPDHPADIVNALTPAQTAHFESRMKSGSLI